MNTWEANIRKVVPYTPGEQPNEPDMIKLNTNENPYPPAPGVTKALKEIHTDTLRLYASSSFRKSSENHSSRTASRRKKVDLPAP